MQTIFLASSFHRADRVLVDEIRGVIEAFGLQVQSGRNLGGEPLEPGVMRRIEASDALVGLFTRREASDGWPTHPWVLGEYGYALQASKRAIAIVETGIVWSATPYHGRERIDLDRAAPAEAVLKLIHQIGLWRRESGRTISVLLAEPQVLASHWSEPDRFHVRYGCVDRGRATEWRDTDMIYRESLGLVVSLPGIADTDQLIQIEVQSGSKRWRSAAVPQYVRIELKEVV